MAPSEILYHKYASLETAEGNVCFLMCFEMSNVDGRKVICEVYFFPFLDALASLRPMIKIKWVIHVFEIASIRA